MGDASRAGMEIASLNRNPFAIDILFPPAFNDINKLIDLRVEMPAQGSPLHLKKHHLDPG